MFHFFFLSVVLFYVLFFALAAKFIKNPNPEHERRDKLQWNGAFHFIKY